MSVTQKDLILAALREGQALSPMDALHRFDCFRLGARIWDLRRQGHRISSTIERRGRKHVAVYRMGEQQ